MSCLGECGVTDFIFVCFYYGRVLPTTARLSHTFLNINKSRIIEIDYGKTKEPKGSYVDAHHPNPISILEYIAKPKQV